MTMMNDDDVYATVAGHHAEHAEARRQILISNRRRRLEQLLETAGARIRAVERARRAAMLDLGEILRAVREHNNGLPDGDERLIPQSLVGRETGMSAAQRDELEAHIPDDSDKVLPDDGQYRAGDLAGYSNTKIAQLWSACVGEEQPAVEAEFYGRFPEFAAIRFLADELYHHWQDNTPGWFMETEPAWLKVPHDVLAGLGRSIIDGPSGSDHWPGVTPPNQGAGRAG